MTKKTGVLYRVFSLLLVLLMITSTFCMIPFTADAETSTASEVDITNGPGITNETDIANGTNVTKVEKIYDIAVVFDNSGSMYKNQAWCRAKYAMEIFASMLNYDKDKLHIFPMWEVTTDGSKPNSGGSHKAIAIKSKDDIDKISDMYTVRPSYTPFAPIKEAYNYLEDSTADEKWLVILTDGAFNQEARGKDATIDLQKRVSSLAGNGIKIQYLGFGEATELEGNNKKEFFTKKSSDTSLKDDLIGICNAIFQRSILPGDRLNGENLNLDLSMKNIIVFAQGANAKITSLKDSNGNEVPVSLDSGQRKYSEIKAKGYSDAPVDKSLAGQVVTFTGCPKGEYTLSYTGADKIQIFYEPDVDIDVSLVNSDGIKVDGSDGIAAGKYTLTSRIVDASTGEDVTSHELMGNDVKLNTYAKTDKDSKYTKYANGSEIVFYPDENANVYIEGKYLSKYTITSKNDPRLAWLSNFTVKSQAVEFLIDATVLQSQAWFKTKSHDDWKPIRVAMTLDGQPLTDEQLANVNFNVTISDNLPYRCEPIPGESAYNVYIAQDEKGNYTEPETGKYTLTATATYSGEYVKEIIAEDSASFEIQKYSKFWRWLLWVLIILLLLALWLIYMLQKVLPKSIIKGSASFNTMSSGELDSSFVDVEYRRKGKSLTISGSSAVESTEQCSASFEIRAVDNRFTSSKRRRIAIIDIDSPCDEIKIAGTKFLNYEGRWIKASDLRRAESGNEVPPIDHTISCSPRFELSRSGGLSTLNCKTKTIK